MQSSHAVCTQRHISTPFQWDLPWHFSNVPYMSIPRPDLRGGGAFSADYILFMDVQISLILNVNWRKITQKRKGKVRQVFVRAHRRRLQNVTVRLEKTVWTSAGGEKISRLTWTRLYSAVKPQTVNFKSDEKNNKLKKREPSEHRTLDLRLPGSERCFLTTRLRTSRV